MQEGSAESTGPRWGAQPHATAAAFPAEISSRSSHLAGLAEQVWKDHTFASQVLLCNCTLHLHALQTDILEVAEIAQLYFGVPGEAVALMGSSTPAPPWG